MIAFASMLKKAAEQAGIQTPDDAEKYEEYKELYPHFFLFCQAQLGQPMPHWGVHFENAKVIAAIPEEEIKTIEWPELKKRGFQVGLSESARPKTFLGKVRSFFKG